jgi:hypothetical protein
VYVTQLKGHYVNQAESDTIRQHQFLFRNFSQVTAGYSTQSTETSTYALFVAFRNAVYGRVSGTIRFHLQKPATPSFVA